MNVANFVFPVPMTSFDSSTLSGTYQAINPDGLAGSCFLIKFVNNSTVDVTISWDGITDYDFYPKASGGVYDLETNAQPISDMCLAKKGQVFYIKGDAGTGSIYLIGLSQPIYNPRGL